MNLLSVEKYWQSYLQTLPILERIGLSYSAEQFGDTPELADELGYLILQGIKTATCSALWEWEFEGSPIPVVGFKSVVLDGSQYPICIIETTEVTLRTFEQVDAQFAYDEGEGDRTLDYWQREHWRYFSRVLPKIHKIPTLNMPLVCERFRVLYQA